MVSPPPARGRFWIRCDCGKERQVMIDPLFLPLYERGVCNACSDDLSRALDSCPENITDGSGSSACRLTYHHEGRCEPVVTHEDLVELASRVEEGVALAAKRLPEEDT